MNSFDLLVAVLGGGVLVLGLASERLANSPLPPTLLALAAGVLLGPEGVGVIDLAAMGDEPLLRETVARLTLAIGLMGVALRIPREFPRRHWRSVAVLAGPGMLVMWGIGTGLIHLLLGVPLLLAAVIGAAITPTDPIASTPVVTGSAAEENIPERLRHTISLDSGANDGLAYLVLFLPFLLLTQPRGEALSEWLVGTLLWQVGAATVLGLALGYAAARLLARAESRGAIEADWRLIYTVALALLAMGVGRLLGSDELLVVFAAGIGFVQVASREDREEEDRGQEAVNRFFAAPFFVVLGATLPWAGWAALGWRGVLLAAAVLLLRRPPVLLALRPLLATVRTRADALLVGWFGPVAVAAVYYASLMEHRLHEPRIWHVASLVAAASVVVHGATGAPLTRLYGRRTGGAAQDRR